MLDSVGVSIWQMALAPSNSDFTNTEAEPDHRENGYLSYKDNNGDENETSDSDEDSDPPNSPRNSTLEYPRVAIGCDDGCIRIYAVSDSDEFVYKKSLPRVSGEIPSPEF